ncbi:MAG: C4-type zinc ribbon domain-containing protein [bacterium]
MKSVLETLLVLQDRDTALLKASRDLERIPQEAVELERKLEEEAKELEQHKLATQKLEVKRKELEVQVEALKARIGKYRQQQLETRKNEEYQALGHEIERAEAEIHQLEDTELDLMERYEVAQKEVAEEAAQAQSRFQAIRVLQVDLKKRQETLAVRQKELQAEIAELEQKADPVAMGRYRRILASKKDAALVPVMHENTCGGCHMKLTPQIVLSTKANTELVSCEQCGRLLYWPKDL